MGTEQGKVRCTDAERQAKPVDAVGMRRGQLWANVVMEAFDQDLAAIATVEGIRLVVPGAAPGDVVDVRVEATSRHRPEAWGKVERVVARAGLVTTTPCPRAWPTSGRCGGCAAMHLTEAGRREGRMAMVARALGGLMPADVRWVAAPVQLGYRNRANYAVHRARAKGVRLGSFAPGSRDFVSMQGCLVVRPAVAALADGLEGALEHLGVDGAEPPGGLRWVSIRASEEGQLVVELIVRDEQAAWLEPLGDWLMQWPGVVGVAVSVNVGEGNAVRTGASRVLVGNATLWETMGDVTLEITPGAFAQLHSAVAGAMYRQAAQWVTHALAAQGLGEGHSPAVVWDLYGGIGGLGLHAALHARTQGLAVSVWGADAVASSIEAAQRTAWRLWGELAPVRYVSRDLALGPPAGWPVAEVVLVNPPRKGVDEALMPILEETPARVLVYMSCHAASFARDAARLCAAGWELVALEVHDMLPQTPHVELLGRFVRASPRVQAHAPEL